MPNARLQRTRESYQTSLTTVTFTAEQTATFPLGSLLLVDDENPAALAFEAALREGRIRFVQRVGDDTI